jgi:hypothetical protein
MGLWNGWGTEVLLPVWRLAVQPRYHPGEQKHSPGTPESAALLLKLEEFAEALGLRAAHGNLGLLLVVHAQLVA